LGPIGLRGKSREQTEDFDPWLLLRAKSFPSNNKNVPGAHVNARKESEETNQPQNNNKTFTTHNSNGRLSRLDFGSVFQELIIVFVSHKKKKKKKYQQLID